MTQGARNLQQSRLQRRQGFTLAEMVIAIVVIAIISAGVALFIRLPVRGYVDTVARADITDTGDTALRRIARDIRLAIPNTVRVSPDGTMLEMLLSRSGGRYLATADSPTSGNVLDYSSTGSLVFDVVGTMPTGVQTMQVGDSVVVFNTGSGANDAYGQTGGINRTLIAGISGNTITMASNPFGVAPAPVEPDNHRFQVMIGAVTYRCDATAQTLTRYWNYNISATQPTTVAALSSGTNAASALLANGVQSCLFSYGTTAFTTSALAELDLVLTAPSMDNGIGGTVSLFQQVHVDNTP